jgi:hypothetical protein
MALRIKIYAVNDDGLLLLQPWKELIVRNALPPPEM